MPTEGVGGLVMRLYEALHNDHDLTMINTAVDPKVVCRWSGLPELHGSGELRAAAAADLEGFPAAGPIAAPIPATTTESRPQVEP
jgi:hypothetical protein